MLNVMYNFTNVTDEVMTQRELQKSPEGQDFIKRWSWPNQDGMQDYPRFRVSNTVEDYLYVRVIEADLLLAVGAIRIHWKDGFKLMTDTNIQIVICAHDFHYCQDPNQRYDLEAIVREKLYQYLVNKTVHGRYTNQGCPRPCPPPPPPHPPMPKPPCPKPCDQPPYFRGHDDRGLHYKNHGYCGPCAPENHPKNGPYGGTYNAYDECHHHHHHL